MEEKSKLKQYFANVLASVICIIHIIIFFSYNIGVIYKSNTRRHVRENVRTGLSFVITMYLTNQNCRPLK